MALIGKLIAGKTPAVNSATPQERRGTTLSHQIKVL